MTSITITGLDEVLAKLGKMERVHTVLRRPMDMSVKLLENKLQSYPGPRAGSKYIRTRRLGNSWTSSITSSGGGLQGKVGNVTLYAIYVQGPRQVWYHADTGWKKTETVAKESEPTIRGFFADEIKRAIK